MADGTGDRAEGMGVWQEATRAGSWRAHPKGEGEGFHEGSGGTSGFTRWGVLCGGGWGGARPSWQPPADPCARVYRTANPLPHPFRVTQGVP